MKFWSYEHISVQFSNQTNHLIFTCFRSAISVARVYLVFSMLKKPIQSVTHIFWASPRHAQIDWITGFKRIVMMSSWLKQWNLKADQKCVTSIRKPKTKLAKLYMTSISVDSLKEYTYFLLIVSIFWPYFHNHCIIKSLHQSFVYKSIAW